MNEQASHPDHNDPVYRQAIEQLEQLLKQAHTHGGDPTAASLATSSKDGRPSVRIITVASVSIRGILIFAHHTSGKSLQMQQNPHAALCFHWPAISREVIIEGDVSILSDEAADVAWNHLPREVGLAHWASDQVSTENHQELKQHMDTAKQRFNFERIPRPPSWYGFEIHPHRIDFWQTGWGHLQPRKKYHRSSSGSWIQEMINP